MKKFIIYFIAWFAPLCAFSQGWQTLYGQGKDLLEKKEYRQAARVLQKAIYEANSQFGENHENYRNTANLLAKAYYEDKNFENSSQFYKEVCRSLEAEKLTETDEYAEALTMLGRSYEGYRQPKSAAEYYTKSLEARQKMEKTKTKGYVMTAAYLASIYLRAKRPEQASTYYKEAYTIGKDILTLNSAEYRNIVEEYGDLHMYGHKNDRAIELYKESLEGAKKHNAPIPSYLHLYKKIAETYQKTEDAENTVKYFDSYIAEMASMEKVVHEKVLEEANKVLKLYRNMEQAEAAQRLIKQKLEVQKEATGEKSTEYASTLIELGEEEASAGLNDKAEAHINAAIEIEKELGEGKTASYAKALDALGRLYVGMGKTEEGEKLFKDAIAIRKENLGTEHPDYSEALDSLAYLYIRQERLEEAEKLIVEAKDIREKTPGKTKPAYGYSLGTLAELYIKQEKFKEAGPLLVEQGKIFANFYGQRSEPNALNAKRQADFLKLSGKTDEALKKYQQVLILIENTMGKEVKEYKEVKAQIKEITDNAEN